MKTPYGIVYLTSRIFRGEVVRKYVGRHKWRNGKKNDSYLGSGVLLTRAIEKYGRKSFIRETLQECYSHEELNKAEAYWVDKLDAVNNPLFYNLALGGMNTGNLNGIEVHQYSLDGVYIKSFKNAVEASEEVSIGPTTILKATDEKYKNVHSAGGFQWRREKLDNLSKVTGTCEKAVKCYTLTGEFVRDFKTCADAARWVKAVNGGNIVACCKRKRVAASCYQWRYFDHTDVVENVSTETKIRNREIVTIHPITNEVTGHFKNAGEAAKTAGVNAETIRNWIKYERTIAGFLWKHAS